MKRYILLLFILLLASPLASLAQEELLQELSETGDKPEVMGAFNGTYVISAPTTETAGEGEILLNFVHRFGPFGGSQGGSRTLWGLDNLSDLRLAFYYGITDKWHIGVGRSKTAQRFDFETKYKLLSQRQGGFPVSVAILGNIAIASELNTTVLAPSSNEFDEVELYPTDASRLSYVVQLPIAKKFSDRFSLVLVPTYLHRNYVPFRLDEFDMFSLAIGSRLSLSKSFALTADYYQSFSPYRLYKVDNYRYFSPLAVGFEVVAGGHVFQMNISNSAVLPNEFLVNNTANWGKSEMRVGFNIVRAIGTGKKHRPEPGVVDPHTEEAAPE